MVVFNNATRINLILSVNYLFLIERLLMVNEKIEAPAKISSRHPAAAPKDIWANAFGC